MIVSIRGRGDALITHIEEILDITVSRMSNSVVRVYAYLRNREDRLSYNLSYADDENAIVDRWYELWDAYLKDEYNSKKIYYIAQ